VHIVLYYLNVLKEFFYGSIQYTMYIHEHCFSTVIPPYYLITPCVTAGESTKIFCGNIKLLLFEDEEYKRPIFINYNIGKKIEGLYVKI
jgi:hypothetical protein